MSSDKIDALKAALFEAYDGFADKRIKNLVKGKRFIVDGRGPSDIASDGNVYGWFCSMFLDVESADEVTLSVHNIPLSPPVSDWLVQNGLPFARDGHKISLGRGEQAKLIDLADRVENITAPGRRYDVRHYKYAVPRVADALHRLKAGLDEGWEAEC
jgi:hypothetical protein